MTRAVIAYDKDLPRDEIPSACVTSSLAHVSRCYSRCP